MKKVAAMVVVCAALVTPAHAGWQDSPEIKALYEKAKAEGEVTVWGTTGGAVDWMPKAFGGAFPGIKVNAYGDNDITTKAITEARGGRNAIDVFQHSLTGVVPLVQRDLVAVEDFAPFGVRKEDVVFDGRAAAIYNIAYTVGYNATKVDKADLPKTWEELTDPKYKSKLVASLFLLPRLVGALSLVWGKDKAIAYARALNPGNDVLLTRAPREPIISSGERLFGVGEIDSQVRRWQQEKMPINYVVPEPVVLGQFVIARMAKSPHPNAARLLAGWLASHEGRKAQEDTVFVSDYGPEGTSETAKLINSGKVKVIYDTVELMQQRERAIAEMGPIVAGQK
jgi:iron(III) transport system substrate-binding protein